LSGLDYQSPWLCFVHQFHTQDKAAFFKHLHDVPHYLEGDNGVCEVCGVEFGYFKIPYEGFNEPAIILCPVHKDSKEYIRAKRRSEFPPEKSVKSF